MSVKSLFADVRVSHLPLPAPALVSPTTPLSEAIAEMKKRESGCILIADKGRLKGIFTERDLLNRVLGKKIDPRAPIASVMTERPVTSAEDAFLVYVVDLMGEKGYRHVPLVSRSGQVKGVISVTHIITYLAEHFPAEVYNLPPRLDQRSHTSEGG